LPLYDIHQKEKITIMTVKTPGSHSSEKVSSPAEEEEGGEARRGGEVEEQVGYEQSPRRVALHIAKSSVWDTIVSHPFLCGTL